MQPQIKAFHQLEDNFFSIISLNTSKYENISAYFTGVPASNLNPAFVKQVDEQFQLNLEFCRAFYRNSDLPWVLTIPDYLWSESLEGELQKQHFNLQDEGVALALSLDSFQPSNVNSQLQIRKMEKDLETWSIPLLHGFESVPAITEVYMKRHQIASHHHSIHHFSGFIEDKVICSLTLSIQDNQARLDDIATMPSFQKQGHATVLIQTALIYAANFNISEVYLEASSAGLSLYKKMGFKELFKNRYYE